MDMSYAPHSLTAEHGLLGLLMLDNTCFPSVGEQLKAEEWFIPLHSKIYCVIGELLAKRMEANPITIKEALQGTEFDKADLLPFLGQVFEAAALANDANTLAYVIAEHAYQRRMIEYGRKLAEAANTNKIDEAKALQQQIASEVVNFSQKQPETSLTQIQRAFAKATKGEAMMETGLRHWDDAFGGLFCGSRYIIAGHGGVGKSALAINLAWNMAKNGKRVRWLTFEEEVDQVWWRVFARECGVPITAFRKGLSPWHQELVSKNQERLMGHDFMIFANARDVGEMINWCGKCDMIVIDGMTSAPAVGANNKVDKAGIVTEYCKKLADTTGACVVILAHVNSDSIKTGSSMTGIYGGQAATFDPEGIVDLRWADNAHEGGGPRYVKMHVLKNRYGEAGRKYEMLFNGEKMTYECA